MSDYRPREYWPARFADEGPVFVAERGMTEAESAAQFAEFWPRISAHIPWPCQTLLDFGCGVGRMAPYASPLVGQYLGCDIVANAVEVATQCHNTTYLHLAGDTIPLPAGSVDCVAAVTVLQHIVDAGEFAQWATEIARVLRPGGRVIVLDSGPLAQPSPHMQPRSPDAVGAALGLPVVSYEAFGSAGHWCGVFGA